MRSMSFVNHKIAECPLVLPTVRSLEDHEVSPNFVCSICSANFLTLPEIKEHLTEKHSEKNPEKKNG